MADVGGNCSPLRTGRQTAQQHCRRQYQCRERQHEGQPEEMAEQAIGNAALHGSYVPGMGNVMLALLAAGLFDMGGMGVEGGQQQGGQEYRQQKGRDYVSVLPHEDCKDITNPEKSVFL